MRGEIIIILYCLIALSNLFGSWFWNDMSYALRLIVVSMPLFLKFEKANKISLTLFLLLLLSNISVILSDYKFIDAYDKIIRTPRLAVTVFLLLFSIYQLNRGQNERWVFRGKRGR